MKLLRLLYSLFILALLFAVHIFKYPFRKKIDTSGFLKRFEQDRITSFSLSEMSSHIEASMCICCNLCSIKGRHRQQLDSSDICSRISRDITVLIRDMNGTDISEGECPYGIDGRRIASNLF